MMLTLFTILLSDCIIWNFRYHGSIFPLYQKRASFAAAVQAITIETRISSTRYHSISRRPWAFTHSFPGNGRTGSAYPETKNPLQHATPRRVQNFTETASHHPAALWIPFRPYCSSSKFLNWNLMYHISVFLSSAGIHCPCLLLYGWLPALPISLYIEGGIQIW